MTDRNTHGQNHLLDALPKDKYEWFFPCLELVSMPLGEVLHEPGKELRYAYFPTPTITQGSKIVLIVCIANITRLSITKMVNIAWGSGGADGLSSNIADLNGSYSENYFRHEMNSYLYYFLIWIIGYAQNVSLYGTAIINIV